MMLIRILQPVMGLQLLDTRPFLLILLEHTAQKIDALLGQFTAFLQMFS
jgi:hypothetical protein